MDSGLYKYTAPVLTVPLRIDRIDSRCTSVWNVRTAGGEDPTTGNRPKFQLSCRQLSMPTT